MSSAYAFDRSPLDRSVGGTDPKQQVSDGVALAQKISALVKATAAYTYCLSCLARVFIGPERRVRDSAQRAVVQDGLRVVRPVCYRCGGTGDGLTVKPLG